MQAGTLKFFSSQFVHLWESQCYCFSLEVVKGCITSLACLQSVLKLLLCQVCMHSCLTNSRVISTESSKALLMLQEISIIYIHIYSVLIYICENMCVYIYVCAFWHQSRVQQGTNCNVCCWLDLHSTFLAWFPGSSAFLMPHQKCVKYLEYTVHKTGLKILHWSCQITAVDARAVEDKTF